MAAALLAPNAMNRTEKRSHAKSFQYIYIYIPLKASFRIEKEPSLYHYIRKNLTAGNRMFGGRDRGFLMAVLVFRRKQAS